MEQEQLRRILKRILLREGVSEEKILSEMEHAIAIAHSRMLAEGDEQKLAIWREISPAGPPTAAQFISYAVAVIQNGGNDGPL